jgi:hypothetical protein
MSVAAVLRFTPVYDPPILEVQGPARDVMVQRGPLEKVGHDETTPVLVNHDPGRRVGTVREIYIAPTVDGGVVRDWYFASVRLDDPPDWLARNGAVSWGTRRFRRRTSKGRCASCARSSPRSPSSVRAPRPPSRWLACAW